MTVARQKLLARSIALAALVITLAVFRLAATAFAQRQAEQQPIDPVQSQRDARALVAEMLSQKPSSTNTGSLKIRKANAPHREIPMCFTIWSTSNTSTSIYEANEHRRKIKLTVIRTDGQPTKYLLSESNAPAKTLVGMETMIPFAESDFYIADLGLEFLHWPQQRLIKKEMRRSRFCEVLESTNPSPSPNAYSRVVCWIEQEPPHGIVHADAYDSKGKLFKRFDPTEFQKVEGRYQLQEMEIRNLKANSRTKIEFNTQP
jgi:hypothetical protein